VLTETAIFIYCNFVCVYIYIHISPTLVKLDFNTKAEINFTFKSIGHNGGDSSMHEEISSATCDCDVSGLLQGGVSSGEGDGSLMICAIENKGESEACSESVLGIVNVEALCPTNRFGVKVVVQGDGVIENY